MTIGRRLAAAALIGYVVYIIAVGLIGLVAIAAGLAAAGATWLLTAARSAE